MRQRDRSTEYRRPPLSPAPPPRTDDCDKAEDETNDENEEEDEEEDEELSELDALLSTYGTQYGEPGSPPSMPITVTDTQTDSDVLPHNPVPEETDSRTAATQRAVTARAGIAPDPAERRGGIPSV